MNDELEFFIPAMPDTRPADYYLGYLGGSVFMDFDNCDDECIRLERISFDGFGCCGFNDQAIPMTEVDSRDFKEIVESGRSDQSRLTTIVRKAVLSNRKLTREQALNGYDLS